MTSRSRPVRRLFARHRHAEPIVDDFRKWPISEVAARLIEVRSMGHSGLDLLTLSSSRFDRNRHGRAFLASDNRWPGWRGLPDYPTTGL